MFFFKIYSSSSSCIPVFLQCLAIFGLLEPMRINNYLLELDSISVLIVSSTYWIPQLSKYSSNILIYFNTNQLFLEQFELELDKKQSHNIAIPTIRLYSSFTLLQMFSFPMKEFFKLYGCFHFCHQIIETHGELWCHSPHHQLRRPVPGSHFLDSCSSVWCGNAIMTWNNLLANSG